MIQGTEYARLELEESGARPSRLRDDKQRRKSQQRRAALEPHVLLAVPEPQGRRQANGSSRRRSRRSWRLRHVQGRFREGRRGAVRLGLGWSVSDKEGSLPSRRSRMPETRWPKARLHPTIDVWLSTPITSTTEPAAGFPQGGDRQSFQLGFAERELPGAVETPAGGPVRAACRITHQPVTLSGMASRSLRVRASANIACDRDRDRRRGYRPPSLLQPARRLLGRQV